MLISRRSIFPILGSYLALGNVLYNCTCGYSFAQSHCRYVRKQETEKYSRFLCHQSCSLTVESSSDRRDEIKYFYSVAKSVDGNNQSYQQKGERLSKFLAAAGLASRRRCEIIIAEGRVYVDDVLAIHPAHTVFDHSCVVVDGKLMKKSLKNDKIVYVLNKPLGVVSTAADTHNRKIVNDFIQDKETRLFPVGRLDIDSTGLILLTNDGMLAYRLSHPKYQVPKCYRVSLTGGNILNEHLQLLRNGVMLEDGLTAPADVTVCPGVGNELNIVLREGRNRQIRRMCAAIGRRVISLKRMSFGRLELGTLAEGAYRRLDTADINNLLTI